MPQKLQQYTQPPPPSIPRAPMLSALPPHLIKTFIWIDWLSCLSKSKQQTEVQVLRGRFARGKGIKGNGIVSQRCQRRTAMSAIHSARHAIHDTRIHETLRVTQRHNQIRRNTILECGQHWRCSATDQALRETSHAVYTHLLECNTFPLP